MTEAACDIFGFSYEERPSYDGLAAADPVLVCGAGLLPNSFIHENTIINAHPGLIPYTRARCA